MTVSLSGEDAAYPFPVLKKLAVYSLLVHGLRLTYGAESAGFVDAETGSRWTVLGRATSGPHCATGEGEATE